VLAWASRRGSALQAAAIIGWLVAVGGWLLGRIANAPAFEACLCMAPLWGIGTWLQKH
jgi:hypothetical protein